MIQRLIDQGITQFCVCPGSRNALLIQQLIQRGSEVAVTYHFEERSAAFFALGLARSSQKPVGILVTSGTAAGELLPAAMEATYTQVPLILMTADRPRRFSGTNAPQAAEQVGIFGVYASPTIEITEGDLTWQLPPRPWLKPLHLNFYLEDPMSGTLDASEQKQTSHSGIVLTLERMDEWKAQLDRAQSPLAIVGEISNTNDRLSVEAFLLHFNLACYCEATSGLRESPQLKSLRVTDLSSLTDFDAVVRLGGIPTHRVWRDLERKWKTFPVLSLSDRPYLGMARPSILLHASIAEGVHALQTDLLPKKRRPPLKDPIPEDFSPGSERHWMRWLSLNFPKGSRIFLGNSLPIRLWDEAATHDSRNYEMGASRGLNGIDGQVSTFLGWCQKDQHNYAILGDLTTLYDLAGPWVLPSLQADSIHLIVLNNGGGKIFAPMFQQKEFINSHHYSFEGLARLWKLPYHRWTTPPATLPTQGRGLIEIVCHGDEA